MPSANEKKSKKRNPQAIGLVFELETVLFESRKHLFEAVQKVFSDKKIAATPELFSRYCLHPLLPKALSPLIAAHDKRMSPDKIIADTERVYRKSLLSESTEPDASLVTMLRQAIAADAHLGAVTFLTEDEARQLAARAGLPETLPLHSCCEAGQETPRADCWLRLIKEIECEPRQSIALISAASAGRSAMIAGMRAIAIPDSFAKHEDFTGADLVLDESRALTWTDITAILRPCAFR